MIHDMWKAKTSRAFGVVHDMWTGENVKSIHKLSVVHDTWRAVRVSPRTDTVEQCGR